MRAGVVTQQPAQPVGSAEEKTREKPDVAQGARTDATPGAENLGTSVLASGGAVSAPGPVAAAAPGHDAPPASPMAQIARHVAADPSARSVELRLSPAELGPVQMVLHHADAGQIAVTIHAGRPDTLDLLRNNIHVLAQEFRDIGFSGASFSFGQGSQGGAFQPMPDHAPAAPPPEAANALPVPERPFPPPGAARAAGGGGLDVRF